MPFFNNPPQNPFQAQYGSPDYANDPYNPSNPRLGVFQGSEAGENAIIRSYVGEFANLNRSADSLAYGPILPNLVADYQADFVQTFLSSGGQASPDHDRFLNLGGYVQSPQVQQVLADANVRAAGYEAQGQARVRGGYVRSIGA